MKAQVLTLPGWQSSGPEHWQSRWEALHGFQRVEQHDWMTPRRGDWLARLDEAALPPAAQQVWRPLAARLTQGLEGVRRGKGLADMRRHFETFSDALTEVVRRFAHDYPVPIYRAMCPMVEGRKGFWLQNQRAITNPFHGAAMYRCGEIVEELAGPRSGGGRP